MYRTYVLASGPDDDLARLDLALLRLRRAWAAPAGIRHGGRTVEGSTLLVCLAVEDAPTHPHPPDVGSVADGLSVTHSTASRLVTRAVDAGMITRQRSTTDPRRAALALTADGRRLVAASRDFRSARLDAVLADWAPADRASLVDLLTRFTDAAQQHPRSPG